MKTLIAYATESGVTARCAAELGELIPDSVLLDIRSDSDIRFRDFDTIILGSYVRMGMIDGGMQYLSEMAADMLAEKRVGLFVCGLDTEHAERYITEGFGEKLAGSAKCIAGFGGELPDAESMGSTDSMILKYVGELGKGRIDHDAIKYFAGEMTLK